MKLNWKGYVLWAHRSKKSILSICGAEDSPSKAIYTLLKRVLDFCITRFWPKDTDIIISITVNEYGDWGNLPSTVTIQVTGPGLLLTNEILHRIIADESDLRDFLMQLSDGTVSESDISLSVVNALCSFFFIGTKKGRLESYLKYEEASEFFNLIDNNGEEGILIKFCPDKNVFGEYRFEVEHIVPMVKKLVQNYRGLKITLQERFDGEPVVFKSDTSVPVMMTLAEANDLLTKSVAHPLYDIQDNNYLDLISDQRKAIVFKVNPEGNTEAIAKRILSALESLKGNYKDAFYAYELAKNVIALAPDSSIISGIMHERYNVVKEIAGTDNQDDKTTETAMYLTYTNVIVGAIVPTKR